VAVATPHQQPVASGKTGQHRRQVAGLLGFPPVGERPAHKALLDQGDRGVVEVGFIPPQRPAKLQRGLDELAHLVGLGQVADGSVGRC
jgi:hypothetical protein